MFFHPIYWAFTLSSHFPERHRGEVLLVRSLYATVVWIPSAGPTSSLVFRLCSDIILYLDRLNISYGIIQGVCESYMQCREEVEAIKQPRLSFLSERADIFYGRLFLVSLLLPGYCDAQFNSVSQKKKNIVSLFIK